MDERTQVITHTDGEVGITLGALYRFWFSPPYPITIVYVTVSPSVDDTDASIDIDDDGTNVISAIDCSDKNVPGTWKSVDVNGTNAPVKVAANSLMALDANNMASGTRAMVQIHYKA